MLLALLLLFFPADTVVTFDVTEDASLPDDPGALNSSSSDDRCGTGDIEGCSSEAGERNEFMAKWRIEVRDGWRGTDKRKRNRRSGDAIT